ncbi:MAG: DUF885 family protein [Xanthomonadaceae bacterium]|nr:DUF885 family protein [Xanthomonadaceae bacterium]
MSNAVLPLLLLALFSAGLAAQPATIVADPAGLAATDSRMSSWIQRYRADLKSVEHVHDIALGLRREAALRTLHTGWLDNLRTLDDADFGVEDRIDRLLFERQLRQNLQQLDFDARRVVETAPLLPGHAKLVDLLERRRALEFAKGQPSAEVLDGIRRELAERLSAVIRDGAEAAPGIRPAVAYRAAAMLERSRNALKDWYAFYADFDPDFTWWVKQPYESLDKVMEEYIGALRGRLAGADDPETIIGDPIGAEALQASLDFQMIPYSPEELVALAERELAWTRAQMTAAAKQMGYDDWRKALEFVKTRSPAPGQQPALVKDLADEAVGFLRERELITIPELATRDWRMNMLSPEAQLQAPFFLGGVDVWVAYPTSTMPHDKRMMSLRGNNRHFSRAVVHHELIPGHHLQHFMTQRYQPHRQLFGTPFWTEGWALYWEFRLYDLGFAATPEDKLGMLFWRAHRAARIQFSLGFHLGKMTPQQAIELLVDNGHERENAAAEVRRSFAGDYPPIYQAAYMLGGLQFLALHRELVGSGRMTERDFHDRILQGGPMPVEMVRARLLDRPPAPQFKSSWRFYRLDDH